MVMGWVLFILSVYSGRRHVFPVIIIAAAAASGGGSLGWFQWFPGIFFGRW